MISGFRHEVDEKCALLSYYAASSVNCLQTFRDNVSVPSLRVKTPRSPLRWDPIGRPEMSARNYHSSLCNNPETRSSRLVCVSS